MHSELKALMSIREPLEKIWLYRAFLEIPAKNGKLYVSAIFDCYDLDVLGLSMSDNMKTELCTSTIENMVKSNPSVCGMILHSDRGSQYTSASYRAELSRHGIIQSMNSDGAMIMHAVRLCGQE